MRTLCSTILATLALTVSLAAAGVDGKWVGENKMNVPDKGEVTMTATLDVKADGSNVTGTFSMGAGRRPRAMEISNGKLEGETLTFTTKQTTKKGDMEVNWKATVSGDEMKLQRQGRGGKRNPAEITLKRQ